jgi:hypothetical protein
MAGTKDLTTAEGKAAWWQQRAALDTTMKQLLQDLGSTWLGPWRCLLLPGPAGQETVSAAASAAGELVEEQFGAVLGECTVDSMLLCMSSYATIAQHALHTCPAHMVQHGRPPQSWGGPCHHSL